MSRLILLIPFILLAACAKQDNAPGPGGVSVGEAKALDEAAAMLEEQRLPDTVVQPVQASAPAANVPVPAR